MAEPDPQRTTIADAALLVPGWLENLAALSWRVLVVVAFAVVAWLLATTIWTVTASILVAIVVSAVFAPYVLRLRAQGRSRNAAAGIVWTAAMLVICGLLVILAVAFLPRLADVVTHLHDGIDEFQATSAELGLPEWVGTMLSDFVDYAHDSGAGLVGEIVASVANAGTILILAAFLVFFFLRDGDKAWLWAFQSLGADKLERITTAGDEALDRVGGYLRGTTVLALAMAASNYVFMLLLGVPLALPLAILTFATTYIPYFGGIVSTVVILAVTLSTLDTTAALIMLVLMGLRSGLVSYLLRPMIYGRTVSMHPALVLIVLPAGFQLAGMVGLFAAVPVTAVVLTVARSVVSIIEPEQPPELPELVPAWLDRAAQWSWRALVAIALMAVLVLILTTVPLVVIPLILALIIAATLEPLVEALVRRGRSRGPATAVTVGGSFLAIVGILALTMASLVADAPELGDTVIAGAQDVNDGAGGYLGLGSDAVAGGARATVDFIVDVSGSLAAVGTIVILSVLLAYYFLRDGERLWSRLIAHTRSSAAPELSEAGRRAFGILGGYMIGTGAISFVGAASQLVIMWALGLPLALPVFVLSFFGGFIPYIGSALTTLLALLVAVAVGDPVDILVMLIWTVVFNLVQGNIVAPLVYGRTTHIHPAIVLVSIPAGSAVAGILGMFIVVPVIGVVAATWRTVLSVMGAEDDYRGLGSDDPIEPEAGGPAAGGPPGESASAEPA